MLRNTLILFTMLLAVGIANAGPLKLTDKQMDKVTAGALVLPTGELIFAGFDNPAPGGEHPTFRRSSTGAAASGNEGPWTAAFNDNAIGFSNQ